MRIDLYKDRTFPISLSVIRGLQLPLLCNIFSVAKNCSCQHRILFHVRGDLLIILLIHFRVVGIEPVWMYLAMICPFQCP